mmetsp:Transcript_61330/g.101329  ORF Transcript_61330/g.101329 Transcript_61330/m.101329 type:complete len:208 (+) Transcript_61330:2724-3347(+)
MVWQIAALGWKELGPSSQTNSPSVFEMTLPPTTSLRSVSSRFLTPWFLNRWWAAQDPLIPLPTISTSTSNGAAPEEDELAVAPAEASLSPMTVASATQGAWLPHVWIWNSGVASGVRVRSARNATAMAPAAATSAAMTRATGLVCGAPTAAVPGLSVTASDRGDAGAASGAAAPVAARRPVRAAGGTGVQVVRVCVGAAVVEDRARA